MTCSFAVGVVALHASAKLGNGAIFGLDLDNGNVQAWVPIALVGDHVPYYQHAKAQAAQFRIAMK